MGTFRVLTVGSLAIREQTSPDQPGGRYLGLYAVGECGDILNYGSSTYKNPECHIKNMKNRLSRKLVEHKGLFHNIMSNLDSI